MTPLGERVLLRLWWVDATNRAGGWHDAETLDEFATNGAWEASNTGWLVYEDERCYVLAGRMTDDGEHVGLVERIPKAAVTRKEVLQAAAAHVHNPFTCPAHAPGCGCRDLGASMCNPYRKVGYCPDDLPVMPDDPRYPEAVT